MNKNVNENLNELWIEDKDPENPIRVYYVKFCKESNRYTGFVQCGEGDFYYREFPHRQMRDWTSARLKYLADFIDKLNGKQNTDSTKCRKLILYNGRRCGKQFKKDRTSTWSWEGYKLTDRGKALINKCKATVGSLKEEFYKQFSCSNQDTLDKGDNNE